MEVTHVTIKIERQIDRERVVMEINDKIVKDDVDHRTEDNGVDFNCHICLDVAQQPVVSVCGHLFCWPCLHRWLCMPISRSSCPVCKSPLVNPLSTSIVPLFGKGMLGSPDPRNSSKLIVSPNPHSHPWFNFQYPDNHNHHFPHPHPLLESPIIHQYQGTDDDLHSTSSSPYRQDIGFTSRHQTATIIQRREAILFRLYFIIVCLVIILIILF